PNRIVLRASHSLADSTWTGQRYRLLMHSQAEIETYLLSVPVGAIVVDRTNFGMPNLHQPLLEQTIAAHPETWKLVRVFPGNPAERQGGGVRVYRMIGDSQPRHHIVIRPAGTLKRQIIIDPGIPGNCLLNPWRPWTLMTHLEGKAAYALKYPGVKTVHTNAARLPGPKNVTEIRSEGKL